MQSLERLACKPCSSVAKIVRTIAMIYREKSIMNQRTLVAFILSLLGGLWMLASGQMMYGGVSRMPMNGGWGTGHMMWGRGMMGQFGFWWPWFGTLAGTIVIVSAIILYFAPQYRRSLGTTILVISVLNLFLGMGGLLASVLGIAGGIISLRPKAASQE